MPPRKKPKCNIFGLCNQPKSTTDTSHENDAMQHGPDAASMAFPDLWTDNDVEQQNLHKAVACHTLSLPLLFTEVLSTSYLSLSLSLSNLLILVQHTPLISIPDFCQRVGHEVGLITLIASVKGWLEIPWSQRPCHSQTRETLAQGLLWTWRI